MLTLSPNVRIYLASEPVDLRKGFDGLSGAARDIIRQDPLSGHLFVFINKRANRMKLLVWQRSGFLLLYKRLERGRFRWPRAPADGHRHIQVDATELALMLDGIDLRGATKRPQWRPQAQGLAARSRM